MSPPRLTRRELNRALLARQLLLEPSALTPAQALTHLVGLQSQAPQAAYVALWTRLRSFDPHEVSRLLKAREAVRIALMRSTVHLVTAADAGALRPLLAEVVARGMTAGSARGKQLAGVDRDLLVRIALDAFADGPLTNPELLAALRPSFPGVPDESLLIAVRGLVPLVQVPPRGLWRTPGTIRCLPLPQWIGSPETRLDRRDLVRRYLSAFGPASVADIQAWSGLTRLAADVAAIRAELVEFADENGRTVVDLVDAPRPGGDIGVPVRLLAEWDQILLAHADRSRIISGDVLSAVFTANGVIHGGVLVDGEVAGMWSRSGRTVLVQPLTSWTAAQRRAVQHQAEALAAFFDPARPLALEFNG